MLPQHLSNLIYLSRKAVAAHPQHQLDLGYRWALYQAMGERKEQSVNALDSIGHQRRTYLALKTANLVLPFWNEGPLQLPPDNLMKFYDELSGLLWNEENYQPAHLLQMANQIMLGVRAITKEDFGYAERVFLYYDYFEVYYPELAESMSCVYAGICAAQAFYVSVKDEIFDGQINLKRTEEDIQDTTYKTEAAFFASLAYAGSSIWNPRSNSSNNRKRMEFWEWWLMDAIPEAWHMGSE